MPTAEATKRRGRPPAAPEDARKVRALRLNDARWHKLQRLGSDWLEKAIDRAKLDQPSGS